MGHGHCKGRHKERREQHHGVVWKPGASRNPGPFERHRIVVAKLAIQQQMGDGQPLADETELLFESYCESGATPGSNHLALILIATALGAAVGLEPVAGGLAFFSALSLRLTGRLRSLGLPNLLNRCWIGTPLLNINQR